MTTKTMFLTMTALTAASIARAAPLATGAGGAASTAINEEGAAKVGGVLRLWLGGLLDPSGAPPAVRVTPEGDHYALSVPLPLAAPKAGEPAPALTADARPLGGEAYAVDNVKMPTPLTRDIPHRTPNGSLAQPLTSTMSIDNQQGGGTVDPSFVTPTAVDLNWKGLTMTQAGQDVATAFKATGMVIHIGVSPIVNGHVDFNEAVTADHVMAETKQPGAADVHTEVENLGITLNGSGVDPTRVRPALTTFTRFTTTLPTGSGDGKPPKLTTLTDTQRKELHDTIELLRGFASGGALEAKFGNMGVVTPDGMTVTLASLDFGMGAQAHEAKTVDVSVSVGFDGIAVPNLPETFSPVVPRNVVLKLSSNGMDLATLTRIALNATATPPVDPSDADGEALFGKDGAKLSMDALSMDVGGASLTSTGMLVANKKTVTGHAHVTVTGFDALNTLVQTTPGLTPGLAVLGIARSFARPDPDAPAGSGRLMWNIDYDGAKVTINGIDASAMIPRPPGAPNDAPPGPSPRPRPGGQAPIKRN